MKMRTTHQDTKGIFVLAGSKQTRRENHTMTLFYCVTSPHSPIEGWVGRVVRRKTAGWVMLCFWRGIQQNFKEINLELVPRTEVPVPGEVTPNVLVDLDREEAPGEVQYWVVSARSAWDREIGVLVASKTPWPGWVTLAFNGVRRRCLKKGNLRRVTGACEDEASMETSTLADSATPSLSNHARRLIAGSTLAEEEELLVYTQDSVFSHSAHSWRLIQGMSSGPEDDETTQSSSG